MVLKTKCSGTSAAHAQCLPQQQYWTLNMEVLLHEPLAVPTSIDFFLNK